MVTTDGVTRLHGCHNKPDRKPSYTTLNVARVQGAPTWVVVEIPDVMSQGCGYSPRTSDPSCKGCRHVE